MGGHFTRTNPDAWWNVMLVLSLLACVLGLVWVLNRWQQRRSQPVGPQPMALYLRVQRKLGLSLVDRWQLWRLAKVLSLEHPTALLVSARMYDKAVERYCASRGWLGARSASAHQFASIRKQLFQTTG